MKCTIAKNDGFICPAVNSNGECTVYADEGIIARERWGTCSYKEVRRLITKIEKRKIRMGQQKQIKKKVNLGNIE